jgi:pyruvate-formate lyase-activating enzyme
MKQPMAADTQRYLLVESSAAAQSGLAATTTLAVFHASCTADCLFCQNWHFPYISPGLRTSAPLGVKKLGPPVTARPLMGWKLAWAAISVDVETVQFQARASAGWYIRLFDR